MNFKAMLKVEGISNQIKGILKELKISHSSSNDKMVIKKAICAGYFGNAV